MNKKQLMIKLQTVTHEIQSHRGQGGNERMGIGPHHGRGQGGNERMGIGPHHGRGQGGDERAEGRGPRHGRGQGGEERMAAPRPMPPSARNALMILLAEKQSNQRTLATLMHVTAQGASETIRKLEERGLILRQKGEAYNENIITLTEKGEEVAKMLENKVENRAAMLFKNFTEEDIESFGLLLDKLNIEDII